MSAREQSTGDLTTEKAVATYEQKIEGMADNDLS